MGSVEINLTPTATLFQIAAANSSSSKHGGATVEIMARSWGTVSECQAAALLIHGLGGHSGWFEALARRLKVRKLFVLAYDLLGFGKRIDEPYYSARQWFAEIETVYAHLQSLVKDKPIYLIGNSMGAIVALKACPKVKPAGLALLSPAFEGHSATFRPSYRVKAIVTALLSPDQEVELPYDLDLVTSEPSVRDWLTNDPERRSAVPGRMLLDLLWITQTLSWDRSSIDCPCLMMISGRDQLVDNGVNRRVFKRLRSPSKKLRAFETSIHDLTLEPAIEEVSDEIAQWIAQNVASKIIAV